jgi:hypothetical protein
LADVWCRTAFLANGRGRDPDRANLQHAATAAANSGIASAAPGFPAPNPAIDSAYRWPVGPRLHLFAEIVFAEIGEHVHQRPVATKILLALSASNRGEFSTQTNGARPSVPWCSGWWSLNPRAETSVVSTWD